MPSGLVQQLTVFIASPGDLDDERDAVSEAIVRLSSTLGQQLGVAAMPMRYEQIVGRAGVPQSQINVRADHADLFIGLVNRRWGSPTGNGPDSGFGEEYDRALASWNKAGKPRIVLFFKRLETESISDPGPQLAKVLAFKAKLESEHAAFYNEFTDPKDLVSQVQRFLIEEMVETAKDLAGGEQRPATASSSQLRSTDPSPGSENHIARLLRTFLNAIDGDGSVGRNDFDRLELFALSLSEDRDRTLSPHLANRLYQREDLGLTVYEARLWFRAYLADIGRNRVANSRNIPFAMKVGGRDEIQDMLEEHAWLVSSDETLEVKGYLKMCSALGLRPSTLWPKRNPDEGSKAGYAELWRNAATRLAPESIEYWATVGTAADLRLARILRSSGDSSLAQFGQIVFELLSAKPIARTLATVHPGLLSSRAVRNRFEDKGPYRGLDSDLLNQIVLRTASQPAVRLEALKELASRDAVDASAMQLLMGSNGQETVLGSVWERTARAILFDREVSPAFIAQLLVLQKADTDNKMHIENALARVAAFSPDTDLGLTSLPAQLTLDQVRVILLTDRLRGKFADLAWQIVRGSNASVGAYLSYLVSASVEESLLEFVRERYASIALDYLTSRNGAQSDQKLVAEVRKRTRTTSDLRFDWITYLLRVYQPADVPFLLANMRYVDEEDRQVEIAMLLAKATLSELRRQLDSETPAVAALALRELSRRRRAPSDSSLKALMLAKSDPLRLIAAELYAEGKSAKALKAFLSDYMRQESFYYNVVCEFDRRLAALPRCPELALVDGPPL